MIRPMMSIALLVCSLNALAQSPAPTPAADARPVVAASPAPTPRAEHPASAAHDARAAEIRSQIEAHRAEQRASSTRAAHDATAARREMEQAKVEMERASARLAELSQRLAREDIEAALARPAFDRPIVGVVLATEATDGVRLAAVTPESPAAKAGLRSGDVLLQINGVALEGSSAEDRLRQARDLIGNLEEDDEVKFDYRRGDKRGKVALRAALMPGLVWWRGDNGGLAPMPELSGARLADLARLRAERWEIGRIAPLAGCGEGNQDCEFGPMAEVWRWRGLRLAAIEPKLGRYFGSDVGVLVLSTPSDELQGLEPGDVLLQVQGETVTEPQQAMQLMRAAAPGDRIRIELLRDRTRQRAELEAPKQVRFAFPPAPPAPPAPPRPPKPPTPAPDRAYSDSAPAVPAAPPAPDAPQPPPPPPQRDNMQGVLQQILN